MLLSVLAVGCYFAWGALQPPRSISSLVSKATGYPNVACIEEGAEEFATETSASKVYDCQAGTRWRCFTRRGDRPVEVTVDIRGGRSAGWVVPVFHSFGDGFRCAPKPRAPVSAEILQFFKGGAFVSPP